MTEQTVVIEPAGWTEERVELLKKLFLDGLSAAQIAGVLGEGATRNSVLGKIHRMKLAGGPRKAMQRRPRAPKVPKRQPVGLSLADRVKRRQANASLPPFEAEPIATIVDADIVPVPLMSLNKGDCKWPIGDPRDAGFGFCGHKAVEDKSYCEAHLRRAHTKREEA